MTACIAGHYGRVFRAAGQVDLQQTRPVYAFVPLECIDDNGFDLQRYLASRWPSANCGANPHAIGSHVIPNPTHPVNTQSRCPVLAEFLTNIESIARVKNTQNNT